MRKLVQVATITLVTTSTLTGVKALAVADFTNQPQVQLLSTSASTVDYNSVLTETQNYLLQLFAQHAPVFTEEWPIMGLARNGYDGYQADNPLYAVYYGDVIKQIQSMKGVLSKDKYTEYSRLALAVTAMGKDARKVGSDGQYYNLFDYLSDYQKVVGQGINGADFALIAADTRSEYQFTQPAGVTDYTTKDKLVAFILSKELANGGWNLYGKKPDVDITAMTLQALTPYQNDPKVKAATDRGVALLSTLQNQNGSFSSQLTGGGETSESIAQVIVTLSGLGIDADHDSRFVKNGGSALKALAGYHVANSGFMHVLPGNAGNGGAQPGAVDGMATEQANYALVAYSRYQKGENRLYDMNDVATESDKKQADAVTALLQKLGTITSLDQAEQVKAARSAYNGLTQTQKNLVNPAAYQTLVSAETKITGLENAKAAAAGATNTSATGSTGATLADKTKQSPEQATENSGVKTSNPNQLAKTQGQSTQASDPASNPASGTQTSGTNAANQTNPGEAGNNAAATEGTTDNSAENRAGKSGDRTTNPVGQSEPATATSEAMNDASKSTKATKPKTAAKKATKKGWDFDGDSYLPNSKTTSAKKAQSAKDEKPDLVAIAKTSGLAVGFQGLVVGAIWVGKLWIKKGIL